MRLLSIRIFIFNVLPHRIFWLPPPGTCSRRRKGIGDARHWPQMIPLGLNFGHNQFEKVKTYPAYEGREFYSGPLWKTSDTLTWPCQKTSSCPLCLWACIKTFHLGAWAGAGAGAGAEAGACGITCHKRPGRLHDTKGEWACLGPGGESLESAWFLWPRLKSPCTNSN